MDSTALIIVLVVLALIVLILAVVLVLMRSTGRRSDSMAKPKKEVKRAVHSFEELSAIIKAKGSSAAELQEAIDELLDRHGHITDKLGIRPHPDLDRYVEVIFAVCRHRHTSKELVLSLDKGLSRLNPTYRLEIDNAVQTALSSRGM